MQQRPHLASSLLIRRLATLGLAVIVTTGLLAAPSQAAPPSPVVSDVGTTTDLGVTLGVSSVTDLAVGDGRVFVSAGDRIVVANSGGDVTGAITGLSQVHELALTPDGTRLYAALHGSNEVAEIDTATLTITRRIGLAEHPCPSTLALSGDHLWIGRGCDRNWQAGVIGLNVTEATPTPILFPPRLYSGPPAIAAAGGTLVAGQTFSSPASLTVYDIGQETPTLRGTISGHTWLMSGLQDVVLTSDGSAVVAAASDPTRFMRYDTTTLFPTLAYGGYGTSLVSVAINSDDTYLVGGRRPPGIDLTLYDAATGAELLSADNPAGTLVVGSIAFAGADVYALLRTSADRLHLWRLPDVALPMSRLTLTTSPRVPTGTEVLITGQLTRVDGSALGAQPLKVTRRLPGGTRERLDRVTTAADGTFTITDRPPGVGKVVYTVAWAGDDITRASSTVAIVRVRHRSSLTMTGPALGTTGTEMRFSGVLETGGNPPPPGATLTVKRTVRSGDTSASTMLPPVSVSDDGTFTFTDTPATSGRHIYLARWAGNGLSEPAGAPYRVTVKDG
ncbi:hypothetical protein [Nonomuraea jiangxiensis]|uniref:40-residue YVTN family beta-propeller repeat-containing protein n=1 Tax=Nonomuraea jiangxiensis TaxID=633440 RepID=A0A1G8P9F9_9ACTN|nr:hypothetical protein [Nonomuraea jiangxiensis]SDI88976.1 40-residue YVTN family beta-propeller repeat-containing protein [Nonomuraea jiangxiensis]